jgi:hypothetical protein
MPGYFDFFKTAAKPRQHESFNAENCRRIELIFHRLFTSSNRDRCDIALSSCLMPARRGPAPGEAE